MMQQRPPMGWNTWNTFGPNIDAKTICENADLIVSLGLKDAGYDYIVIDDGWALEDRDEQGRLVPDPKKFPNGMKAVADYVHAKGLKFGMYTCSGSLTCEKTQPGSYDHEYVDAKSFAEWEVDFLKFDFCNRTPIIPGKYLFRRMGAALANSGREILFSACSWGSEKTHEWVKTTGASMWRSTVDIANSFESIKKLTLKQLELLPYNGHGCFNDMDMLVVGMNNDSFIDGTMGTNGCTLAEQKTHFSIWSMFGSPLMIGCDLRLISKDALEILTNKEAIAINQDATYSQPYRLVCGGRSDERLVFARLLSNGDFAVGIFNLTDEPFRFTFGTDEMGVPTHCGKTLAAKEVWTGEEPKLHSGMFNEEVEAHGCRLYRCRVIDA